MRGSVWIVAGVMWAGLNASAGTPGYDGVGEVDCPILDTFDLEGESMASTLAGYGYPADFEAYDVDFDGLSDSWSLGLVADALCEGNAYTAAATAAYLNNVAAIEGESAFALLAPFRHTLAGLILTSQTMHDVLKGTLFLDGKYQVVGGAGKASGEPFSGGGDLDGDLRTNLQEATTVIAGGGGRPEFLAAATNYVDDGTGALPIAGVAGLAALAAACVAAAGLALRRK